MLVLDVLSKVNSALLLLLLAFQLGFHEELSLDILVIHDAVDRLKYDILHWSEIATVI